MGTVYSNMEILHVYLSQPQKSKLARGKTIQLSAQQMSSTSGEAVEIHMLRKHASAVRRAIKNGKAYRFNPTKIEMSGGKINLGHVGKVVGRIARQVGHVIVKEGVKEAKKRGYDVSPIESTLHSAIPQYPQYQGFGESS